MQQMMQNKFVSPTTAGTKWGKIRYFNVIVVLPNGPILIKLLFAVVLSIVGTFFCPIN